VTTVAYGDIYPTTALGRVVATAVMTTDIAFVALLTSALAQRFLYGDDGRTTQQATQGEDEVSRRLTELAHEVAELRRALERVRE
jgi:voltage-gated potassium channel